MTSTQTEQSTPTTDQQTAPPPEPSRLRAVIGHASVTVPAGGAMAWAMQQHHPGYALGFAIVAAICMMWPAIITLLMHRTTEHGEIERHEQFSQLILEAQSKTDRGSRVKITRTADGGYTAEIDGGGLEETKPGPDEIHLKVI